MKHNSVPLFSTLGTAFLGLLLAFGCAKPTPFGADLLDNEIADYAYTDTLTLNCTILPEDSISTSDVSSTADFLLCGQLNDPSFGISKSEIFTQLRLEDTDPGFKNAIADSVVLYLRLDAGGFYGDTTQLQSLRVHRLGPDTLVRWDKTYYSNQSLPVSTQIGELVNFLPKPNTGARLFDTASTATKAPYIRVPLDKAFAQEILDMDSLTLTSDTAFWRKLRGLHIEAEPSGNPGAMMAFDLNNTSFSRIRIYFKEDTTKNTFDLFFYGANKFTKFTHDYTGSTVGPLINKPAADRLFVQGMSGLKVKIEIPYAHLLSNVAINKAELELTAAPVPNENSNLTNADQLVFTELLGDTAVTVTSDVIYSLGPTSSSGFSLFGGFPEAETDQGIAVKRYRLTLTRRFQDMVDNSTGELKKQTVYLNVYPQSRSARRAILYSPASTTFPAKLAVKYTKVQ